MDNRYNGIREEEKGQPYTGSHTHTHTHRASLSQVQGRISLVLVRSEEATRSKVTDCIVVVLYGYILESIVRSVTDL